MFGVPGCSPVSTPLNPPLIEEDSFTVQLTFSDGNCSPSIYLLAFHLCFVSKTLSFCLQITCIHVC